MSEISDTIDKELESKLLMRLNTIELTSSSGSTSNLNSKTKIDEQMFKKMIQKHRISGFFARKLKNLKKFKIVYILDDSGSMNTVLEDSPLNKGTFKATRWDELQDFINISIEIANIVNPEGCDVYFLNRRMVKNVKKSEDILSSFKHLPGGFTPITKILTKVLKNNMPNVLNDKKLLVIIVTDGEPTDSYGKVDIKGFKGKNTYKKKVNNILMHNNNCRMFVV